MRKTDILDVVARKLSPYMFLFGFYLVSFGDRSPGGGFQGGVVVASGVILLAMTRGVSRTEQAFPSRVLSRLESLGFLAFLGLAIAGLLIAGVLLGSPFPSPAPLIAALNAVIGMKVAAGISVVCLALFREE